MRGKGTLTRLVDVVCEDGTERDILSGRATGNSHEDHQLKRLSERQCSSLRQERECNNTNIAAAPLE